MNQKVSSKTDTYTSVFRLKYSKDEVGHGGKIYTGMV